MCRGLYALRHRRHASKKQAVTWAQREFPQWAPVPEDALVAADDDPASETAHHETTRFIEIALRTAQQRPFA